MALAINMNDLLNKQKIESNRIEFKKGWNPGSIYHSICAFANDFDDLGGGYIIVGVDTDDKTGMAIRPVEGVPMEKIDNILQEMVGYNNKMAPYYLPRTSVEEVDGKTVDSDMVSCWQLPSIFCACKRNSERDKRIFLHSQWHK